MLEPPSPEEAEKQRALSIGLQKLIQDYLIQNAQPASEYDALTVIFALVSVAGDIASEVKDPQIKMGLIQASIEQFLWAAGFTTRAVPKRPAH